MTDSIGTWVAFALTLLIFSIVIGDNPLYRLALHVLIGVALAYAVTVGWSSVLLPRLVTPLTTGSAAERLVALVPLALGVLLLTKALPRRFALGGIGNISVAFLLGVGAAVAVGGAVLGTLLPQTGAATASLNPFPLDSRGSSAWYAFWALIGTATTLAAFTFMARPPATAEHAAPASTLGRLIHSAGRAGRIFLMVAFGSLYAGALIATIAVLADRVAFVLRTLGVLS
jgi:hypothetical protein